MQISYVTISSDPRHTPRQVGTENNGMSRQWMKEHISFSLETLYSLLQLVTI